MLIDTTLREGEQFYGAYFAGAARKDIIRGLVASGVEEIELGCVGQEHIPDLAAWATGRGGETVFSAWCPLQGGFPAPGRQAWSGPHQCRRALSLIGICPAGWAGTRGAPAATTERAGRACRRTGSEIPVRGVRGTPPARIPVSWMKPSSRPHKAEPPGFAWPTPWAWPHPRPMAGMVGAHRLEDYHHAGRALSQRFRHGHCQCPSRSGSRGELGRTAPSWG